ncbi:MAG: FliI/YscN family ATPase [Parvularculaceae bacterium]
MSAQIFDIAQDVAADIDIGRVWGSVSAVDGGMIRVSGLSGLARIGDRINIVGSENAGGEIIAIEDANVLAMPTSPLDGISVGARAYIRPDEGARPSNAWLGKVLNAFGEAFDGSPAAKGVRIMPLSPQPLPASERRALGARVNSGLAPFDTFLPLCRGQRIGLFAGSGVGKSTLIADLAKGVEADVVVIALIGERSREIREFAEQMRAVGCHARSVIIVSTCNDPAPSKRRAALLAMTTAEFFRDQGLHVLLLFDSITRFADAHREIGLTAGETPSLRAYPPSTARTVAALAERAGPGLGAAGDITAIFTVLVAGSDMDEPVADMVRSILDGHVVLDRGIAERGRFPAIDIRRSVSRSLPMAASEEENRLLSVGRSLIAAFEEAATMIQTGLYAAGSDPVIDRAISLWPKLDSFVSEKSNSCKESFERLSTILKSADSPSTGATAKED